MGRSGEEGIRNGVKRERLKGGGGRREEWSGKREGGREGREGAPLSEHTTSLQEKGKHFTEQRIWKIFTQVSFHFRLGMRQGWNRNEI